MIVQSRIFIDDEIVFFSGYIIEMKLFKQSADVPTCPLEIQFPQRAEQQQAGLRCCSLRMTWGWRRNWPEVSPSLRRFCEPRLGGKGTEQFLFVLVWRNFQPNKTPAQALGGGVSRCRGCCTRRRPSWRTARNHRWRVWWDGSRRLRRLGEESRRTTASPGTSSSDNAAEKHDGNIKSTQTFLWPETRESTLCLLIFILNCLASKWFRRSATIRSSRFPNSFFGGNSRAASWNRKTTDFIKHTIQQLMSAIAETDQSWWERCAHRRVLLSNTSLTTWTCRF